MWCSRRTWPGSRLANVDQLMESLGRQISRPEVSRIVRGLDQQVEASASARSRGIVSNSTGHLSLMPRLPKAQQLPQKRIAASKSLVARVMKSAPCSEPALRSSGGRLSWLAFPRGGVRPSRATPGGDAGSGDALIGASPAAADAYPAGAGADGPFCRGESPVTRRPRRGPLPRRGKRRSGGDRRGVHTRRRARRCRPPRRPLHGGDQTAGFYRALLAELRLDHFERVRRWYGDDHVVDESGLHRAGDTQIREHPHHGISDRLLGRSTEPESRPRQRAPASSPAAPGELTDEQALERYRYLVRTAPPEAIEQAHEEAFAKLTPEQRRMALRDLSAAVPEHERTGADDPRSLARMATRAETNRPGTVERAFGGGGGMLGGIGGNLLGSFAAAFAGSLVAQSLFSEFGGGEAGAAGDGGEGEAGDAGADTGGGDFGSGDFGGGDVGF